MKKVFGIRGACCAENTAESITNETVALCRRIFLENALSPEDIVSIQFTLTRDLDEMNPCSALRKNDVGLDTSRIPLFCAQEAYIKGGLEKVIRILITAYLDEGKTPKNCYIDGADVLRPEFSRDSTDSSVVV